MSDFKLKFSSKYNLKLLYYVTITIFDNIEKISHAQEILITFSSLVNRNWSFRSPPLEMPTKHNLKLFEGISNGGLRKDQLRSSNQAVTQKDNTIHDIWARQKGRGQ